MEKERFLNLAGKALSGTITSTEQQEFTLLMELNPVLASEFENITQNWQAAGDLGSEFTPDAMQAWEKVRRRISIEQEVVKPIAIIRPFRIYMKYAALLILLIVTIITAYLYGDRTIQVATIKGEHKKIILPDQSVVWLNEQSRLEYPHSFGENGKRMVKLYGEGYFNVTKNASSKFIVAAKSTFTTVLGTSFNIRATNGKVLQVALMEGKISFSDQQGGWTEILKPGEMAYVDDGGRHGKKAFVNSHFLFWKNRELRFTNQPLADVLAVLYTTYHVQFLLRDTALAQKRITTLIQGDSVQNAIDVLQVLLDVRFIKEKNHYIIQSAK